tara:strand:- start:175 stop:666 length:492 start_codon:yes stop_codon:yes gene_type:complete
MKIPKKRGRPRLSDEEKARRKKEREAAKEAARKLGPKARRIDKQGFPFQSSGSASIFILTPSGKCPVDLLGTSRKEVFEWASHLKKYVSYGKQHTVQSISYWIRDFYDIFSEEYKIVKENLKQIADELKIKDYTPIFEKRFSKITAENNYNNMEKVKNELVMG